MLLINSYVKNFLR